MADPSASSVTPGSADARQIVTAAALDAYLAGKGSPIAGSGADIIAVGQEFNLDPRLLVAIAGAETTFGTNITAGENNVCNVLYNGHKSPFVSYKSAFHSAGKSIRNPANRYNLATTATFYARYCSGSCGEGLGLLDTFMHELGADTSSLRFPVAAPGR